MSEKEAPSVLDLQTFLAGPTTPIAQRPTIGQHWHATLEAILFASTQPLSISDLHKIVEELPKNTIHQLLLDVQQQWHDERRGIQLVEVATGWQFRTHPSTASYVQKMQSVKPKKLSKAAMEALAVVAYRQPVTRAEVEQIRGVDSSAVLYKLVQLNLVQVVGKKEEEAGKPEMLGTTPAFLSHFNLRDLLELPSLSTPFTADTPLNEAMQIDALDTDDNTTISTASTLNPLEALQVHLNPEPPTKS